MTMILIGELVRACGLLLPVDVDQVMGYRRYDSTQLADAELLAALLANARPHVRLTFATGQLLVDDAAVEAEHEGSDVALEASSSLRPLVVRSANTGTSVHLVRPIDPSR